MLVEQTTNLMDDISTKAKKNHNKRAMAAYQSFMPESDPLSANNVRFDKAAGVSDKGSIDMATYPNPAKQDKETAVEQLEKEQGTTEKNRKNEMVIVSNTTSAEDYKKMEEDGFSLADMDSRTIITVTDKIKAVLAKAGVDISQYGDTLTKEQLQEITGNPAVANCIRQTLEANDLPVTDANMEDSLKALEQAVSLPEVSDEAKAYLIKNEMEPSISNVYTAQHSGTNEAVISSEESNIDFDSLQPQIEEIITEAELEVDEENVAGSKWLIANDIPLTGDNLQYFKDLGTLSEQIKNDQVDWNQIIDSMAKAIAAGKRPQDASMITARRQLEETRLAMTIQGSKVMERNGIEVDTQPLEELVENLKEQEVYYHGLLESAGIGSNWKNVNTMAKTLEIFEDLKKQPAYVIGQIDASDSIQTIHDKGSQLQQELDKARQSYEALMTSPRKDMGDSIQKAFANVNEILTDMNMDITEGNRRAVRILAYNNTEITPENLTTIKGMDEEMQRAFRNMNPAVTMEMIRKGENPLDMSMEQLNKAVEEIKQETGSEEQERFNKFLWRMEQNHEISKEERSCYIGIYRLIAQVEKTDGAALGFLMNQGADITMRNLLTAVRSSKKGNTMDYRVSDDFEGVQAKSDTLRIDEQIEAGFQQNCLRDILDQITPEKLSRLGEPQVENMTPEQLAEALAQMEETEPEQQLTENYRQEQLYMYQKVLSAPEEVYSYLDHYDIPNSMANVLAASEMLRKPNQMMNLLWKQNGYSTESRKMIKQMKEKVLENFGEAAQNPEALADAQEELADVAEKVMDTMITENPEISTLDIRAMRQMTAQFSICARQAREECYMVPVQIGESVTGVSLKVVRGKEEKGVVDILFDGGRVGRIAASFQAKDDMITGLVAASSSTTEQLLSYCKDEIAELIAEGVDGREEIVDLRVVHAPDLSLSHYEMAEIGREQKMRQNGELAEDASNTVQTSRLYHIAECFIQSLQVIGDQ
ncbi:MAG: DUF6240 domain-containing protein [Lachnospiraceae bacterium]|nr:DUF6240 domain-containing protein [Lachnospiraceae bacterium]